MPTRPVMLAATRKASWLVGDWLPVRQWAAAALGLLLALGILAGQVGCGLQFGYPVITLHYVNRLG